MEVIANGVRLQVIEAGQGDPVICIHGNGLNRELWRHLMPELSQGNRAVVYELRGMGLSESVERPGTTVTVRDHANDLAAVMDVMEIDRAAVVAHAFGGFPAMQLAIDRPDRISALIMTCTSARMQGATREVIPYWIETAETVGMGPLVESGLERWFTRPFRAANPDIMDRYRRMIGANPPLGYAANGRGILAYDLTDSLHEIACPVVLISGKEDRSTPTADHQLIADRVRTSELIVVDNASHTVPEEQPDRFNDIVLDFLDGQAGVDGASA